MLLKCLYNFPKTKKTPNIGKIKKQNRIFFWCKLLQPTPGVIYFFSSVGFSLGFCLFVYLFRGKKEEEMSTDAKDFSKLEEKVHLKSHAKFQPTTNYYAAVLDGRDTHRQAFQHTPAVVRQVNNCLK